MTLSKEMLKKISSWSETYDNVVLPAEDTKALVRELLERRERDKQEPVAYMRVGKGVSLMHAGNLDAAFKVKQGGWEPLYAAPPASVGFVNRLDALLNGEEATGDKTDDDIYKDVSSLLEHALYLAERTKAYRAAMIQSFGNSEQLEPVSQPYKLPDGAEAIRNAEIAIDSGKIQAVRDVLSSPVIPVCWCRTCRPVRITDMRFVVCPECGNKRCPKANDHRNSCSESNEAGQDGSAYPAAPKQESK